VLAVAPAQETTDDDMLCIGMISMENERGKEEHCLPALQQALYSMDGKLVSSELDQLLYDTIEKAASVVVLPIVRFAIVLDHIISHPSLSLFRKQSRARKRSP
jgi:hypothetical protein